jgi:hypothetical protein
MRQNETDKDDSTDFRMTAYLRQWQLTAFRGWCW